MSAVTSTHRAVVVALPTAAAAPVRQHAARRATRKRDVGQIVAELAQALRQVPAEAREAVHIEWAALIQSPDSEYLQRAVLRGLRGGAVAADADGAHGPRPAIASALPVVMDALLAAAEPQRDELAQVMDLFVRTGAPFYRGRLTEMLTASRQPAPRPTLADALPVVLDALAAVADRRRLHIQVAALIDDDCNTYRNALAEMLTAARRQA